MQGFTFVKEKDPAAAIAKTTHVKNLDFEQYILGSASFPGRGQDHFSASEKG